jgi:hypothetical protein
VSRVPPRHASSLSAEHNARHQDAAVLSMFVASVPKLRALRWRDPPIFPPDLFKATV